MGRFSAPFAVANVPAWRTLHQSHPGGHKGGGTLGSQGKTVTLAIDVLREAVIIGERYTFEI